jgi:hypothetical protein
MFDDRLVDGKSQAPETAGEPRGGTCATTKQPSPSVLVRERRVAVGFPGFSRMRCGHRVSAAA